MSSLPAPIARVYSLLPIALRDRIRGIKRPFWTMYSAALHRASLASDDMNRAKRSTIRQSTDRNSKIANTWASSACAFGISMYAAAQTHSMA